MRSTTDSIGNVMVESEFHGALLDELEGIGQLDRARGVVEVVDPDSSGYGPVHQDLVDLLRHLERIEWEPIPSHPEDESYEGDLDAVLMIGDTMMLRRVAGVETPSRCGY